ncbi:MAG: hypothetical protein PUJ72_06110 [Eubacteriales bacterium]|nr:hypothetical protein [Eubacteriales bacterium]
MSHEKLKIENAILKTENAYYKRRLASLTGKNNEPVKEFLRRTNAERNSGYVGYLKNAINMSATADVCSKIFFALKRFLLASSVVRIAYLIIILIQSGATIAIAAVLALMLLPAAFLISMFGALIAVFSRNHCKRRFENLSGTVYIVYEDVAGGYEEELKKKGTLMCVSNSIFKCGFLSASKPKDGKTYIHISFVFSLVRFLVPRENIRIVEIF